MAKNKLIPIVGIIVLIALGFSLWGNYKQFTNNRDQAQRIVELSKTTSNGTAVIVNKYIHDSIEHVVTREVAVKTSAEKTLAVGAYVDTVAQALKVAVDRITELTKVNAQLTASLRMKTSQDVAKTDSQVASPVFKTYNDQFLSLIYQPDNDSLQLSYRVSLNQAKYWKRSWLLAPRIYYLDFWSDDPRVNINGVKRYTTNFPEKPRRWGIGLSAGYGYIPTLNKGFPYVGASLNYNLIEF